LSASGKRAGSFRSSVRFDPDRAVVATIATDDATTVFSVCLDGDQALAEHPAPADLTLLVIEGQPTITVEGAPTVTATGDVMIIHEGALHSLTAGPHRAVVVGVLHNRT